jgi:hypothetical protein
MQGFDLDQSPAMATMLTCDEVPRTAANLTTRDRPPPEWLGPANDKDSPSDAPLTRHVDGQILDTGSLNWLRIEAH